MFTFGKDKGLPVDIDEIREFYSIIITYLCCFSYAIQQIIKSKSSKSVISYTKKSCKILKVVSRDCRKSVVSALGNFTWYRRPDLNRDALERAGDFKSPVSTIPPRRHWG